MANMHRILVLTLVVLCLTQHCGACMKPPEGGKGGETVPQKPGDTPPRSSHATGGDAAAAADSISDAAEASGR